VRRGDIVIVSAAGDYGKPRPAVVVQSDALTAESVLVALLTSETVDAPLFRLSVEPTEGNGLKVHSQGMMDKIVAMPRAKCSAPVGSLDRRTMIALSTALAVILGIAG
jgi:mRNA interferase MazF